MSKAPKLTARALCLVVGMLLSASCGNEFDTRVTPLHIPQGMTELNLHVQPISAVRDGDHVDVLMMDKGRETVMLQNVEVLSYERKENFVFLVVTKEDADRVMQEAIPQLFRLRKL